MHCWLPKYSAIVLLDFGSHISAMPTTSIDYIRTLPNLHSSCKKNRNSVDPDQVALPEVHSAFCFVFQ